MALLHGDKSDEQVQDRPRDEGAARDAPAPVAGAAVVDTDVTWRDTEGVADHPPRSDGATSAVRPSDRMGTYGLIARTVIFTLAVVAVVAIAVENPDDAAFDLVFEQYVAPLWTLVVLSAALGAIAGLVVRPRRAKRASTS